MNRKQSNGMTLTELLVVIGIIGILASILMPTIKSAKVKAVEKACRAEIRDFETACRNFHDDFGFYPADTFGSSYNTYINTSGLRANSALSPLPNGALFRDDSLMTPDDITGPQYSSAPMVFFLGSEFTISGKSYGPYCEFKTEQLDPDPRDSNWTGKRYPYAQGVTTGANSYTEGSYGGRAISGTSYTGTHIVWKVRGVDDDNPGQDVRLFQYLDKFGPPRRGNRAYFDWYVYDAHNGPSIAFDGWGIYGPEPQPPDHNMGFVDISCYGFDGNTSINVSEGSGGGGEDVQVGEGDDVGGDMGKALRGMWKDDINNWTTENWWPQRLKSQG